MKKICITCHKEFDKGVNVSVKTFITTTKFCSIECFARYKKMMGIKPPSREGSIPWNYGGINLNFRGNKNPKWKGGVSQINKSKRRLFMETFIYKNWRKEVFKRDNFTCRQCGSSSEYDGPIRLEAHHPISYLSLVDNNKEIYITDVRNGITLCKPCHQLITNTN